MTIFEEKTHRAIQDIAVCVKSNRAEYWEELKHQYAGMAMQGMLSNPIGFKEVRNQAANQGTNVVALIANTAEEYATALVERMKKEE